MADNCKYKIKGIDKEFSEDEMKAYLANGGKAEYERIKPKIEVSEKNQKQLDKWVNGIKEGKTTQKVITDYINAQNYSDETKRKFLNYISQEIKESKKDTYQKLEDSGKRLYDSYDSKYMNHEMTYEEVMHQLGSTADRQKDPQVKAKYESIRNAFFKEHSKRNKAEQKQEQKRDNSDFIKEINESRLGLSDEELTMYESSAQNENSRLSRNGGVEFKDDNSLIENYDQIVDKFKFDKFAEDLNSILNKFQSQYGEEYLNKMYEFVDSEDNQLDARVSVAVALNNHITELKKLPDAKYDKLKLAAIELKNAKKSQEVARRLALGLNSLRGWRKDLISDMAWVGVVPPNIRDEAEMYMSAIAEGITDEDAILEEEGNLDTSIEEQVEHNSERKKAGYFKRKSLKGAAKAIKTETSEELSKRIEEQKKQCK